MDRSVLAFLKCMDGSVLTFLKCMDGSVLVSLKCMDSSVLAQLRFFIQSAPTRFQQSGNSDVPWLLCKKSTSMSYLNRMAKLACSRTCLMTPFCSSWIEDLVGGSNKDVVQSLFFCRGPFTSAVVVCGGAQVAVASFPPWDQVGQLLSPTILPGEPEGQVPHHLLQADPRAGDFLL